MNAAIMASFLAEGVSNLIGIIKATSTNPNNNPATRATANVFISMIIIDTLALSKPSILYQSDLHSPNEFRYEND